MRNYGHFIKIINFRAWKTVTLKLCCGHMNWPFHSDRYLLVRLKNYQLLCKIEATWQRVLNESGVELGRRTFTDTGDYPSVFHVAFLEGNVKLTRWLRDVIDHCKVASVLVFCVCYMNEYVS
jgi:hypothetical protein